MSLYTVSGLLGLGPPPPPSHAALGATRRQDGRRGASGSMGPQRLGILFGLIEGVLLSKGDKANIQLLCIL